MRKNFKKKNCSHALKNDVTHELYHITKLCLNDTFEMSLEYSNGTDLKWSAQVKSEDNFNGLSMYSTFLIYESDGLSLCMCVI